MSEVVTLVRPEDLLSYMSGIGLTAEQSEAAEDILAGVEAALERYCNRPLVRKERTERVWPDDNGRLWPRATPIISVSSPTSGIDIRYNELLSGGFQTEQIIGGLTLFGGYGYDQPVVLTYVGGIDIDEEPDLKLAIMRVAAREMTSKHDDTMGIKELDARDTGEPSDRVPLGWQDDELMRFDRLRRRTVA